ncbi:unnamed protein product [Closterium sp. Yama58-4]|nr:unnamed protein product [Closterium sp. Yama58-4]
MRTCYFSRTSHPSLSRNLPQDVLGGWAGTLFGVALLAAGQSSTVTGTYAGQYVMQGFIELRISTWLRNLITRLIAIVPALLVALLFGANGASLLIILCSIVSSFGLPFALIPLLKFTSTTLKMGMFATHAWVRQTCALLKAPQHSIPLRPGPPAQVHQHHS